MKRAAFAILLFLLALGAPAKADSTAVPTDDILLLPAFNGIPAQGVVQFSPNGDVSFLTACCDIGVSSGFLQGVSEFYFGTPKFTLLIWNGSMSINSSCDGKDYVTCQGTANLGDGMSGAGFVNFAPGIGYVAIDSLTAMPEPDPLLLLGVGILALVFFRKRVNTWLPGDTRSCRLPL